MWRLICIQKRNTAGKQEAEGRRRKLLPDGERLFLVLKLRSPVAEGGTAECGVPDCTLRQVLEYSPQSTPKVSARHGGAMGKVVGAHPRVRLLAAKGNDGADGTGVCRVGREDGGACGALQG